MVTAFSVMSEMKMGNIVPRARRKRTSLTFLASVLPLHHHNLPDVTTISMELIIASEVSADHSYIIYFTKTKNLTTDHSDLVYSVLPQTTMT